MVSENAALFIHLCHRRNELDRIYQWKPTTDDDDPRIEASREYNAALVALTEQDVMDIQRVTGWTW